MANGQIFIVGDAEMLVSQEASQEAANALLKLLEEPPGASRFILTSSEPGRLLPTIRSRTVSIHLTPVPVADVEAFLVAGVSADPNEAAWAATLSQGAIMMYGIGPARRVGASSDRMLPPWSVVLSCPSSPAR